MFPKILSFVGPLGKNVHFLFSLGISFVLHDQGLLNKIDFVPIFVPAIILHLNLSCLLCYARLWYPSN